MLKIINKGAKSDLPFSPAIQVGDLVYISGQASVEKNTGKIISGTVEEEIRELSGSNYKIELVDLSPQDLGKKSKLVKIQKVN